jgi:hypothetical protein
MSRFPRRAWLLVVAPVAGALVAIAPVVSGDPGPGSVVAQPVLGAADLQTKLMGSTSPDAGSEAWGYRMLPASIAPPVVGGQALRFGPRSDQVPDQLTFVRYTTGTGWQYVDTPVDENDDPVRVDPNPYSARITPDGGGALVVRDFTRPPESQVAVLVRNPGGHFQMVPSPPPGVLLPGEAVAENNGQRGRAPVTAYDSGGHTELFMAAIGPSDDEAVLHWDGSTWSRELVQLPAGSRILALAATEPSNAWLAARTTDGRGVVLLQREDTAAGPQWLDRSIGDLPFAQANPPDSGLTGIRALGDAAQPLTATSDGVWIDGEMRAGGDEHETFTLFFDASEQRVTGSWCDVTDSVGNRICGYPLDARLSSSEGYRSFAWGGDGFGTRVITNPLEPGGEADTNHGTYLRLSGTDFVRMPGGGGNFHSDGAFSAADEGWLPGPVHVTTSPEPQRLGNGNRWPVSARAPLADVTAAPGAPPGALASQALAVGLDGTVLRYQRGGGWQREFLLASNGAVVKSNLRGVAWPEPGRAHAVGGFGSMWLWRSETGLWERDPGEPPGFDGNLMDVAFAPGDPSRGYAVGRSGVILRYGKSWEPDSLPAGFGNTDLTQIAFAGQQAIVAAGNDLLENEGGGWHVDEDAHALLRSVSTSDARIWAVAGLPDGGAVAAGRNVVIERDGPGSPWRFADQPLPGSTVVAVAAVRDGSRVRAIASVVPQLAYPIPDDLPAPDPNVPPPLLPAFRLPGDGYVLAETGDGWRDDQHTAFAGSGDDRPVKSDPVLAFLLDSAGRGWAVGGWSGETDFAGRGASGSGGDAKAARQRVQTAGVYRYNDPAAAPGLGGSQLSLPSGVARFAVAGHAECAGPCSDLSLQDIRPDRSLQYAVQTLAALHQSPTGPRALLYTGGRLAPGLDPRVAPREFERYAGLLASGPGLPVYPAPSQTDAAGGIGSYQAAFSNFYAPFGITSAPPGIDPLDSLNQGGTARTYYTFDSTGDGGRVRVVVIDNARGSIDATQYAWLDTVLRDAAAHGVPSIVMGSRDLNSRFSPRLNTATDGEAIAQLLVADGASAYFFERPEENRAYPIPAGGGANTIPSFGTGTLGYRSPVSDPSSQTQPDALFGEGGYLLAEVDGAHRNPNTNRAPVHVRMIPLIDDISLQPLDGTLIRRSRPALFQGLGRRPLAGDRWGNGSPPSPPGSDPYIAFPPAPCLVAGCSTKLSPEYTFTSSDQDIGDFVKQDPQSTNLRKPFLDAHDKTVTDNQSGLFCAFNAGTTTVTVSAGGLSFSQVVQVLPGSVQRPCGTRPLNPSRFRRAPSGSPTAPPPPAPAPGSNPPVSFQPPPPPAAPAPAPHAPPAKAPPPFVPAFVPQPEALQFLPPVPLPVPPPVLRPSPPSSGFGRAFERQREEEVAPEESQAFARYRPDDGGFPAAFVVGAIVLAALAGATIRGGPRGRGTRAAAATVTPSTRRPR